MRHVCSDILCYNENASSIFRTLRYVVKNLTKDDSRFRTLSLENPKVNNRLLRFEGVLDLLLITGFAVNEDGTKLIYEPKPSEEYIANIVSVVTSYGGKCVI